MPDEGKRTTASEAGGSEPIEGTVEVRTRVLPDRRKPEPTVSRVFGPLAPTGAARHGVEIACTTSFSARRAAYAEAAQVEGRPVQGVLGGSLPSRGNEDQAARVNVRVVSVDER